MFGRIQRRIEWVIDDAIFMWNPGREHETCNKMCNAVFKLYECMSQMNEFSIYDDVLFTFIRRYMRLHGCCKVFHTHGS